MVADQEPQQQEPQTPAAARSGVHYSGKGFCAASRPTTAAEGSTPCVTQAQLMLQHAAAQQSQVSASRPASPLTAISKLFQQHPSLRPPHTAAGELRQEPCGRVMAACVFGAWLAATQQRAGRARQQELLAWHHVQHVQAGVWSSWRVAFEQHNPHHKLMRVVYRARRHNMLSKVGNL